MVPTFSTEDYFLPGLARRYLSMVNDFAALVHAHADLDWNLALDLASRQRGRRALLGAYLATD